MTCTFQNGTESCAAERFAPQFRYCEPHLRAVTAILVREFVITTICEQLDLDAEAKARITDDTFLVDGIGMDSLTIVETVLCFEQKFALTTVLIGDSETIADLTRTFTAILHANGRYVQDLWGGPDLNSVRQNRHNTLRQISAIVHSDLFTDYIAGLGLHGQTLEDVIGQTAWEWIEHVTTVPSFDGDVLNAVDVLLLTKTQVLFYRLESGNVAFGRVALEQANLHCDYRFGADGSIREIRVRAVDPMPDRGIVDYVFATSVGIEGAMEFMSKYSRFLVKR